MRRAFLLPALLVAVWVAPATGQESGEPTVALEPNVAGKGSRLVIDAPGSQTPGGPRITSAVLALQRGFELDARARRVRCTARQAKQFSCPDSARIGSGFAIVRATGAIVPGGSQDFRAEIEIHLAPKRRRGDLAGVVVSVSVAGRRGTARGRLLSRDRQRFGQQLRFERFPAVEPPPGVTVTLRRLHLEASAFRTVRRDGRRIGRTLIRNPPRCRGSWRARSRIGFSDGTSRTTYVRADCRPPRSTSTR